jgi:hypothetical protein
LSGDEARRIDRTVLAVGIALLAIGAVLYGLVIAGE